MTKSIGARRSLSWRLMILSKWRTFLAAHMQSGGRKHGLDKKCDYWTFRRMRARAWAIRELARRSNADEFSRLLWRECQKRYLRRGHPAYLAFVSEHLRKSKRLPKRNDADFVRIMSRRGRGEVSRAAGRFALVGVAGELATEAGVTGWVVVRQGRQRNDCLRVASTADDRRGR